MIKKITDHKEAIEHVRALVTYFSGRVDLSWEERQVHIDKLLEIEWELGRLDVDQLPEEFRGGNESPWNG